MDNVDEGLFVATGLKKGFGFKSHFEAASTYPLTKIRIKGLFTSMAPSPSPAPHFPEHKREKPRSW
jgi:hypothetical protein